MNRQADPTGFDEAVSAAFQFLVDEYGYSPDPAWISRHHLEPNGKRYRNGDHTIGFFAGWDLQGRFMLNFSPVDLQTRQAPSPRIEYRQRWNFTLGKLLAIRNVHHPLPDEGAVREVAQEFADAVRSYASDVVSGDFGVFSPLVFSMEYLRPEHPLDASAVAVFSSLESAEAAVARVPDRWIDNATKFRITGWELDCEYPWK